MGKYDDEGKKLDSQQIELLEWNGCRAHDWSRIRCGTGFNAQHVSNVRFMGDVVIGALNKDVDAGNGIMRHAGIYDANLENVKIGDNCVISGVTGWLCNTDIESDVVIEDCGTVSCRGISTFGNGRKIAILNEGGGRELCITNATSAQTAYLSVMYREDTALMKAMDGITRRHIESRQRQRSYIGKGVRMFHCRECVDVHIGDCALLAGVCALKDGTVDSSAEAPTFVGNGVIAEHFIFQKGSSITDGAMVSSSLVGEASRIGKQFSMENSAFFANCEGFHSEACSIFAGPYSVTHHRSTLLIAAYCLFYNAGSGTNQSNHMYKLGPLHQGILERGCKTGSFSYLLWPCRIGAFTAVIGKHYTNFDTSDFPFSYISEEAGRSTLVPGMNFFTVGMLRDKAKWPARDRRKNQPALDQIVFDVLSPYTAQKMIRGQEILGELYETSMKEVYEKGAAKPEFVSYKGIHIKRLLLKTCRRYYGLIVDKYFGDCIDKKVKSQLPHTLRDIFTPGAERETAEGEWVDVSGLICPKKRIDSIRSAVRDGTFDTFEKINDACRRVRDAYDNDEWNWLLWQYRRTNGRNMSDAPDETLRALLDAWKSASAKLVTMVLNDAEKEFDTGTRTGFGIDGGVNEDFEAVRGTFEHNEFVGELKSELAALEQRYDILSGLIR